MKNGFKILNRRISYDYHVLEKLECGIALKGNEVKSIHNGICNINYAYASVENRQLILKGAHISKWDTANNFDTEEKRDIVLLAHKKEIVALRSKLQEKGLSLIPSRIYPKDGKLKIEICLCKGKKLYDKRETLKKRDMERQLFQI